MSKILRGVIDRNVNDLKFIDDKLKSLFIAVNSEKNLKMTDTEKRNMIYLINNGQVQVNLMLTDLAKMRRMRNQKAMEEKVDSYDMRKQYAELISVTEQIYKILKI